MRKITTFLWFSNQAEEAANLYTSIFPNAKIANTMRYSEAGPGEPGSVMTVNFELCGQEFTALNGGPQFAFTPATSFFVNLGSAAEVDRLYAALSEGGSVMMEPGAYPFSEHFAWVQDRFGVSWQLHFGEPAGTIQPFLMFCNDQYGKAEEAISLYTALFPNSQVKLIQRFEDMDTTLHATFTLNGQDFVAIDNRYQHDFTMSQAISFIALCDNQEEVDRLWNTLTDGGEEQPCGWLVDRYGVTWQVVPVALMEMLGDSDPERVQRVTQAMFQMKRIVIADLEAAYEPV